MAWSKTKTVIVGVAIVLLGIGTTTIVVNALLPVPEIQGTWESVLDLKDGVQKGEPANLRFVLKITETNGSYRAGFETTDEPDPTWFDTFTYKYPYVRGEIAPGNVTPVDISCVGKVNRSGEKMSWKILQGTNAYAMVWSRTTHPPAFPEPLTEAEFAPRPGSDLQGFWVGEVRGKRTVPIQIKIAEADDGTFRADFYSPRNAGTNRFPMAVSYDGTTLKLMPMDGQGMFEGRLRNGGSEIAGDWIQGGGHSPTILTQANYSEYQIQGAK